MRKKRIKSIVLPSIYVLIIIVTFLSISFINNKLLSNVTNYDYSKSLMKDVTESVLSEKMPDSFTKPFVSEKVSLKTGYYSKDYDDLSQTNALITYESTYMPNMGAIYSSEDEFDVIAVYDGTVKKVKEDELLGTTVEIMHSDNLTSYYYSLKEVNLKDGDEISKGTIIGKASSNKIYENENVLLFEVYNQGKSIDPEKFYDMTPDEIK